MMPTKDRARSIDQPLNSTPSRSTGPKYPLTVYYDGACSICRREIALMRTLDRREHFQLIDFSGPEFREADCGLSCERLSAVIHAQWADGTLIEGVEVFRAMWTAVGLKLLARISRWPVMNSLLLRGYAWFAQHRLPLTGRAHPHNDSR